RNHDSQENAAGSQTKNFRQHVSKREFPQPEHEQVDDCRRPRIPGAIERLRQHHAVSVEKKTVSHDAQAIDPVRHNVWIGSKQSYYLSREQYENQSYATEKDEVVETRLPHRAFGALRFPGAQRLTH